MGLSSGYGNTSLKRGLTRRLHVAVREAFDGELNELLTLHRCGNKLCINVDHTYRGTYGDNERDKRRMGETILIGETHPNAKLTWLRVDEIRERHAAGGITHRELASEHGVSREVIGGIVRGQAWRS